MQQCFREDKVAAPLMASKIISDLVSGFCLPVDVRFSPKVTRLAHSATAATSATFAARMAIMDPRYLNNSIASSASTPPVIEIGANGALAATSALDSMI
jgi:hypothetical protein